MINQVVLSSGPIFYCKNGVSLLDAAGKLGVHLPFSCKTGRCSTCKCKVTSGQTKTLAAELGLTSAEKADGWILSCVRTASTDLALEVEDLGAVSLPPSMTLPCRISRLDKLSTDIVKVVLRMPPDAAFDFIPGQYIDVIGPGGVRRSYSLANAPRADQTLELHIRAVHDGVMSQYWFNDARVNDLLRLNGPHGTFFIRNSNQHDLVFLATGTGIAPVKAMLEALPSFVAAQQSQSVTVLWGGRHESDLYFDVGALPGSHLYIPVLSRPRAEWQGERGYVQETLLALKPNLRNAVVYACGSDVMIRSAKAALTTAGLLGQHFYSDAFVPSGKIVS